MMREESGANMREILYSPGYGAGWTTWNWNSEVAAYMLEYRPIIDYLNEGGDMTKPEGRNLIKQLQAECLEKFGKEYVCVLGASDLKVAIIPDGKVKIDEHDGYESYLVEGDTEGWM